MRSLKRSLLNLKIILLDILWATWNVVSDILGSVAKNHSLELSKVIKQMFNYTLDCIWQYPYQMVSFWLCFCFYFFTPTHLYEVLSAVHSYASRTSLYHRIYWSWVGFLKIVILAHKPAVCCIGDISSGSSKTKKVTLCVGWIFYP